MKPLTAHRAACRRVAAALGMPRPSLLIHMTFATAAALVIGLGWAVHHNSMQSNQASYHLVRTHDLLEGIDDAQQGFILIDSAQRGYLLSGKGQYLQERGDAIEKLYLAIDRLGTLTAAEPALYSKTQELKKFAAECVEIALHNARVRSGNFGKPWPMPESRSPVDVSQRFMEVTNEIHDAVRDQMHAHQHRAVDRSAAARQLLAAAVALSVLVLLPAYWGALAQVRERGVVERRLQDLVEGIPVVAWRVVARPGQRRQAVFISPSVMAQRGLTPEEIMRDPEIIVRMILPEDREHVAHCIAESSRTLAPFDCEYRTQVAGGRIAWIHARATLRKTRDGAVLWNGYWDDITARKELENKLTTAYKELEAFSYSVSHDLRSPLSTINGFGQLLSDRIDAGDEKSKHYLSRIRAGARHMSDVIDGLLALAKINRTVPHTEAVDLAVQAQAIVGELREANPGRVVEFVATEPLRTVGDPRMTHQLLVNLLGNAWKFTRTAGAARIELGRQANEQVDIFFIRDNGVGFEMADAGKLFGAFERLHPGQQFEGTGIGLATVRRIVERHGGAVWAESARGQGTTIFFTLGRQPEPGLR